MEYERWIKSILIFMTIFSFCHTFWFMYQFDTIMKIHYKKDSCLKRALNLLEILDTKIENIIKELENIKKELNNRSAQLKYLVELVAHQQVEIEKLNNTVEKLRSKLP